MENGYCAEFNNTVEVVRNRRDFFLDSLIKTANRAIDERRMFYGYDPEYILTAAVQLLDREVKSESLISPLFDYRLDAALKSPTLSCIKSLVDVVHTEWNFLQGQDGESGVRSAYNSLMYAIEANELIRNAQAAN